ncbi:MAG: hypothetical protein NC910_03875 [Candidatus Omnitrophica bacterium]|nr:hypothetical protein [Candidatus Omnitrophota bacterium]
MNSQLMLGVVFMLAVFFAFSGVVQAETITGEVVDMTCYLAHGASGSGHSKCARECVEKGLPVGIKSADGLYLAVGTEHQTANQLLASRAGQTVTATGEVSEKDGIRLISIEQIQE